MHKHRSAVIMRERERERETAIEKLNVIVN